MNNITTTSNTEVRKPLRFQSTLLTACKNSYYEGRNIKLIVNDHSGIEIMSVKVLTYFPNKNMVKVKQRLYSDTVIFLVSLDNVTEYEYKGRSRKR